jgi:NTP pyrophosphatase (non-canonical NTP hydrolase)
MNTIDEIADTVHACAVEHGFHPKEQPIEVFIANQCNNLHAEISELWDAFRAGEADHLCDKASKMLGLQLRPLTKAEEELADIIIRALDVSRRLRIDIYTAILTKHAFNKTRPFRHGKLN